MHELFRLPTEYGQFIAPFNMVHPRRFSGSRAGETIDLSYSYTLTHFVTAIVFVTGTSITFVYVTLTQ